MTISQVYRELSTKTIYFNSCTNYEEKVKILRTLPNVRNMSDVFDYYNCMTIPREILIEAHHTWVLELNIICPVPLVLDTISAWVTDQLRHYSKRCATRDEIIFAGRLIGLSPGKYIDKSLKGAILEASFDCIDRLIHYDQERKLGFWRDDAVSEEYRQILRWNYTDTFCVRYKEVHWVMHLLIGLRDGQARLDRKEINRITKEQLELQAKLKREHEESILEKHKGQILEKPKSFQDELSIGKKPELVDKALGASSDPMVLSETISETVSMSIAQIHKHLSEKTDFFKLDSTQEVKIEILSKFLGNEFINEWFCCLNASPELLKKAHHRWVLEFTCIALHGYSDAIVEWGLDELQNYERFASDNEIKHAISTIGKQPWKFVNKPLADIILDLTFSELDCLIAIYQKRKLGYWHETAVSEQFRQILRARYLENLLARYKYVRHVNQIRQKIFYHSKDISTMSSEEITTLTREQLLIQEILQSGST